MKKIDLNYMENHEQIIEPYKNFVKTSKKLQKTRKIVWN